MTSSLALGAQLTLMGMGLVFAILTLLWVLISLLSWTDRHAKKADAPMPTVLHEAEPEVSAELTAAIIVAVLAHRSERRREAGPEVRSYAPGSLPSRWVGSGRTRQTQGWEPGRRGS